MRNLKAALIVCCFSLLPLRALATCPTSVTVKDAGTEFVITGTVSGQCGGATVWVCIDTTDVNRCSWKDCPIGCSYDLHVGKACQVPGNHTAYAIGSCMKPFPPNGFCNFDDPRGVASTEFSFSNRPTASLTMTDADATGNSNVSVNYDLNGLSTIADIDFYVDGGLYSHERLLNRPSGSYEF